MFNTKVASLKVILNYLQYTCFKEFDQSRFLCYGYFCSTEVVKYASCCWS